MVSHNHFPPVPLLYPYFADENRGHLLEAGFPQEIVLLLEGYAGTIPKNTISTQDPLPLTIPYLKIVKTAIGVLLNASIGYGLSVCLCVSDNC
jgi:hypothetical protein